MEAKMKYEPRLPRMTTRLMGAATVAATLVFGSTSVIAESAQSEFNTNQTEAIGQIVREYLLENPQIMIEVFDKLEAQQAAAEKLAAEAAIARNSDGLFNDGYSYVHGNPDGDVTVVEFFDYKCGYCKRAVKDVLAAVEEDPNIRLVYKEFPILSEQSEIAARAAMAAISQNKYMEMHLALMATSGDLDEDRIMRIADDVGLDTDRLKQDMKAPGIQAAIDRNHQIAREIGIEGTPAFIIGSQLVPGAVGKARLLEVVEQERTGCVSC